MEKEYLVRFLLESKKIDNMADTKTHFGIQDEIDNLYVFKFNVLDVAIGFIEGTIKFKNLPNDNNNDIKNCFTKEYIYELRNKFFLEMYEYEKFKNEIKTEN